MAQRDILVLVGSLRADSLNRKLAQALAKLAPADVGFTFAQIGDLPLYNQDDDADQAPSVQRMKAQIRAAHGVLFVTPEYNRSIPGVLKNAIDQASRPWGQSKWVGKPAAVCGVSIGTVGTAVAQSHLHSVLSFLAMPQLGQPEMYIQWKEGLVVDGAIGQASREHVQKFVDALVAWMRQHQA